MNQRLVQIALVVRDYDEDMRFSTSNPKKSYGKVAVFADLYGNLWDLIEPR